MQLVTLTLQSVSTMSLFFLAMTVNPNVQVKAREEIDRVICNHRLPALADRPNLPYVEAKGAMLIPNIW